jgi:filamentous hemagglutinin
LPAVETEALRAILENLAPSRNPVNPFVTAGDTGEAVPLSGGSGSNSAIWNNKTGTVWDSVTPTQGTLPVTELPRSFILETEGENVWVAPNAVKHLQQDAAALINNQAVNPMFVQIQVQANLTSLQEAVGVATQNGITYDTLMNVGGWELKFSPGRAADQLPALFHALPTGVGR